MELRQAKGKRGNKHGVNQQTNTGKTRRQTRGKPGDKHGANHKAKKARRGQLKLA